MINLHDINKEKCEISISKSNKNNLFRAGLQYAPPARGTWNIVHIGFLMPESHEIFVCAEGCLRGVILTAFEAGLENRFSTIVVDEDNVIDGNMESQIIDGVSDIIERLDDIPKAIQIFTSCIHHFTGCDLNYVYKVIENKFPNIKFIDCYMTPITRKSGITPDEKMRSQLYELIDENYKKINTNSITMIGNVYCLDSFSDIRRICEQNSIGYKDITLTKKWEDYQKLGESSLLVYTNPAAAKAADRLGKRLHKKVLFIPVLYRLEDIKINNEKLLSALNITSFDYQNYEAEIKTLIETLKMDLKNWKVVIDYTSTSSPLNLARFLIENGIEVYKIYLDAIKAQDKKDFEWLNKIRPEIIFSSPTHPAARFHHLGDHQKEKILAIGQKAAYFEGTSHFVNLVESGSYQGFGGLYELLKDMQNSIKKEKNVSEIIQIKGWGCNCAN